MKTYLFKKASVVYMIFLLALCCLTSFSTDKSGQIKKAIPVWAEGREKEMNLNLGFRSTFAAKPDQDIKIKIAASTIYRVFINGQFVGSGPARAAHGYYRVDEYPVSKWVKEGENVLAIEVAGYNINSYYTLDQPSFLLAEAETDGKVVLATGTADDFEAFQIKERLQKVERYSFQRPFTEYYRMKEGYDQWRISPKITVEKLKLVKFPAVKLLPRNVPMPKFEIEEPRQIHSTGTIKKITPQNYHKDRALAAIGEKLKGFTEKELEVYPVSQEIQEIATASQEIIRKPVIPEDKWNLKKNEYNIYDFGTNFSGFICTKIKCSQPVRLLLYFDELLTNDDVKTKQRIADICNHIVYELQPGEYDLETLESYTFRYLKVIVLEGECEIEKLYLREFAYPDDKKASFESSNEKLNKIFDAAKQTFRQNSVDVFMDCPSRERAGWLCDSYFSTITERSLTGYSTVAYNFLENYALPGKFEFLPEGMIPMCYPADHNDGNFIPNWSLWFILQLEDYARNGGDPALVARLQPRVEKLLSYFSGFENEDGLLEKLERWVFVEWSKANELVQDVSYPSNMLYSAALACAGNLYGNGEWKKKAENIRQTVLRQSYNGEFFVDNAVHENGKLKNTGNTTEVCQYYAFFFNVATPDSHPELWKKLVYEFGPNRDAAVTYPKVYRANAFIGNYLRMDILSRYNLQSRLINEVQDFFYAMAEKTGTLWEHMQSHASCNHGFASYIGHVLYRDVLGIKDIDHNNKIITIRFTDLALEKCSGSIPIGEELLELEWRRSDNKIMYSLKAPVGYEIKIENESSATLTTYSSPSQKREMEFEALKKKLNDPPGSFRSAPLWVWNTKVTRNDIDRMLQELKDQGFGGAFVHPRPGLISDYLSDEWFDLYKYSLETGKKLGLDIWIYDENSYPSGFAGGHVPARMPESYNQGQGLNPEKKEILPDNANGYFLCLKKEGDSFIDITSNPDQYKNIEGEYWLYNKTYYGRSAWHGGYSYVDLLYPGVTEKFIEVTMSEGYEKYLGEKLGTEIKGIFTDEPNVSSPGGMRWTPDLFDIFQKQWGYDLKNVLPLLGETEENWKQVRHNYMETLTQMFIDRWAKPWYDYCEERGMYWTGHYWEHGWPDMSHGGDNMAMYAWHQMPAIDMLFNQFNDSHPQAQFGNIRSVKELSSVANQMGYVRTLSETYGGGGWDVTFEDLKRLGDWEYVLGVNFMNQHLSHMTITGARKYDYPPVFTSLSPWWSNYKSQNDYFARLSMLLSQGEQVNDILILEPTTTAWLYYSYIKGHPKTMEIGVNFQHFVTQLEKSQVEYDLGSENIIKDHGKVSRNKFVVGKRAYKKVVIPPMTENLNAATFRLLKQFVDAGGVLVAFSTPTLVDGKESPELKQFFTENASAIRTYTGEMTSQAIQESLQSHKIRFSNISGNDLYHHRRSYNDGELIFLVNSSLTETAGGKISVEGRSLIEIDGMSGDIFTYPFTPRGESVEAEFVLPPAGSLVLFSTASKEGDYPSRPQAADGIPLKANSTLEIKREQDNVLNIDFCNLIIDGDTIKNGNGDKDLYTVEAAILLYRHFGMSNPWNSAIQYRQTIVEKDTFKTGDIKVVYHFTLPGNINKKRLRVVAEQPDIWKVKINGRPISANPQQRWLDSRFSVYEIGKYVETGINTVELSVNPMSIYAEIAPVYLLGDFALQSADKGWIIQKPVDRLEPGSWKTQGQPYYSWDVSYSKSYRIDDTSSRYTLRLKEWKGTLSEVYVNGKKAGIIAYQPYHFDLTPYLKKGNNKIEVRVIGSLKNLLGPHYNRDKGIAGPWHWNGVHKQIPGNDYNLLDYGLMEDFIILRSGSH